MQDPTTWRGPIRLQTHYTSLCLYKGDSITIPSKFIRSKNLTFSLFPTWLGRRSACAGTTPFRLTDNKVSSMDFGDIFNNEASSSWIHCWMWDYPSSSRLHLYRTYHYLISRFYVWILMANLTNAINHHHVIKI